MKTWVCMEYLYIVCSACIINSISVYHTDFIPSYRSSLSGKILSYVCAIQPYHTDGCLVDLSITIMNSSKFRFQGFGNLLSYPTHIVVS